MIEKFARWLIRRRWWIILISFLAMAGSVLGARHLTFEDNWRIFFSKANPDLLAFEELENVYTKNEDLFFMIAPKNGQVFNRAALTSVAWLTNEAWKLPFSTRVDSLANFQHTSVSGDDLIVRNLVENADALSDSDIQQVEQVAMSEPLLVNFAVSSRAHVTSVAVSIVLPQKSLTETQETAVQARRLGNEFRQRFPDIDLYIAGSIMINDAFNELAQKDFKTLVPVMYLVILLAVFFILRSVTGTLLTLFSIIISILTTLGLAGWLKIQLTPISISAPTIIVTVAVADCIHLFLSVLHGMRQGLNKQEAIVEALLLNLGALAITAVSTVVGFLTLNFCDVPPYRDLGNLAAIGVAVCFLFTVVFMPAMLAVLPFHAKIVQGEKEVMMAGFAEYTIRNRKPLLWIVGLLSLLLSVCSLRNDFHDNFAGLFSLKTEIRQALEFAATHLGGLYDILYSVNSGKSGGVSDPSYLKKLDEFANWCRSQPEVVHVFSVADIFKRLNKNMRGDNPHDYRIPESQELAAQYLLLYEMSMPFGLTLNDRINVDKSASRMSVIMKPLPSKQILAFEERVQIWLRANVPEPMRARGTGSLIMFSHIGKRNTQTMVQGDIWGVFTIAIVMILVLKSFKFGVISLIPNILPAGIAFGLWGLFVGRLGADAAPATGITLGILVDDTTHNLMKYLHARRVKGYSPARAVHYVFSTVGLATLSTTMILVAGFLVLAFSDFMFNSTLGILCALTIGIGGIAEFLLMPPLVLKLEEKEHEKSFACSTIVSNPTST